MNDKDIFDYASELIECADRDLQSAKILYDNDIKIYPTILYHIQQAVEKMTKSELVLRKQLDIKELRGVNHKTPNGFMLALDKARKDNDISSFIGLFMNEELLTKAKGYIKDPKEIIQTPKEELLKFLTQYDNFKNSGTADTVRTIALFSPISDKVIETPEERREVYMNLFFLSWITFFHAEITRYPDGTVKPKDYTGEKPFVQIIPDLLKKVEKILEIMKSYKFEEKDSHTQSL